VLHDGEESEYLDFRSCLDKIRYDDIFNSSA